MAEWLYENRPELKRAYIFQDDSLEYSKSTADYFKARWLELGGEVCGEDTFIGGPDLDLVVAGHAPARARSTAATSSTTARGSHTAPS